MRSIAGLRSIGRDHVGQTDSDRELCGQCGSWWQPKMVTVRREIEEAALAVRILSVQMAGIKVLLLPQSSCKVGSRRPERKQSL